MSVAAGQHIIKQQQYDIGMTDQTKAHDVQSRISFLQDTRIQNIINGVLDQFSDANSVYQFDQVALDLGSISLHNYEEELGLRLEEALIEYFSAAIGEHGYLRVGRKVVKHTQLLDQLSFFLESGHFPWNTVETKSASQMLEQLIAQQPQAIRQRLIQLGVKEKIRKRMIYQFDEPLLDRIVLLVAKTDSSYMLEHKNHLLKQHQQQPLVEATPGAFKKVVWDIILGYLFVASNGYFSKKSYLTYLLKKTASAYNLSYADLLESLVTAVGSSSAYTDGQSQFKKIIHELSLVEKEKTKTASKASKTEPVNIAEIGWQELTVILQQGFIPAAWPLKNRQQFNDRMQILISETPRDQWVSHLDSWMAKLAVRRRLVSWLEPTLLDQCIQQTKAADIRLKERFLGKVLQSIPVTADSDSTLLKMVKTHRLAWILSGHSVATMTREQVITDLLKDMLKTFSDMPDVFFNLLDTANQNGNLPETKAVQSFLTHFYRQTGDVVIKKVLYALEEFIQSHDVRLWKLWFERMLPQWEQKTHLSQPQLIQLLRKKASSLGLELVARPEVWQQLQRSHPTGIPIHRHLNGDPNSARVTAANQQEGLELLLHVLKTGGFPWWQSTYSWSTFNQELAHYLGSPALAPSLIQGLRKATLQSKSLRMMDRENFRMLCEQIQAVNSLCIELLDLHHYLSSLASQTSTQWAELMTSWRDQWWSELVSTGGITTARQQELVVQLFQKDLPFWEQVLDRFDLPALAAAWNQFQKKEKSETKLVHSDIAAESKVDSALEVLITNWLKELGFASEKSDSLYEQLQRLRSTQPQRLLIGFRQKSFRHELILKLERGQLVALIESQLPMGQRDYFEMAATWLTRFQNKVSFHEYRLLNRCFADLLLLRISQGPSAPWSATSWVQMLYEASRSTLGQAKHRLLWKLLAPSDSEEISANQKSTNFTKALMEVVKKDPMIQMEVTPQAPTKPYNKLGEETTRDFVHAVHTERVGLIILSPFLHTLFERCQLMEAGHFLDMQARFKAVQLLEYAATGTEATQEHYLLIHKVLCGLPPHAPVDMTVPIGSEDKEIVDGLLQAVTQQWTPMNNTSIEGLRSSFLNRPGLLDEEEQHFYLRVEEKPFDMLLDQLPWSLGTIKLSWMEKLIQVTWR